MLARSVLVGTAFVVAASAQSATTTLSAWMRPQATQGFDISQVDPDLRTDWCTAQRNTCGQICNSGTGTGTAQNDCTRDDLEWVCACRNGTAPDITSFTNTVPFFECDETFAQCIRNANSDREREQTCRDNHVCGYRNASALDSGDDNTATTVTTSTMAPTGSSPVSTSTGPTSTGGAAYHHHEVGTGVFASVFMAVFAFLL